MALQSLTIGICRVHIYAYFYWHMHDFGHEYVETYAYIFSTFFLSFQNLSSFYNFILFKNLLLYI